jgi:hypothetical protein
MEATAGGRARTYVDLHFNTTRREEAFNSAGGIPTKWWDDLFSPTIKKNNQGAVEELRMFFISKLRGQALDNPNFPDLTDITYTADFTDLLNIQDLTMGDDFGYGIDYFNYHSGLDSLTPPKIVYAKDNLISWKPNFCQESGNGCDPTDKIQVFQIKIFCMNKCIEQQSPNSPEYKDILSGDVVFKADLQIAGDTDPSFVYSCRRLNLYVSEDFNSFEHPLCNNTSNTINKEVDGDGNSGSGSSSGGSTKGDSKTGLACMFKPEKASALVCTQGWSLKHPAFDIWTTSTNDRIHAPCSGTVSYYNGEDASPYCAESTSGAGILLDCNNGKQIYVGHFKNDSGVTTGSQVEAGQDLGPYFVSLRSDPGCWTGPHIHFDIRGGSNQVEDIQNYFDSTCLKNERKLNCP